MSGIVENYIDIMKGNQPTEYINEHVQQRTNHRDRSKHIGRACMASQQDACTQNRLKQQHTLN